MRPTKRRRFRKASGKRNRREVHVTAGIECLEDNRQLRAILAHLNDTTAAQTTSAERAIARVLQASCQSPVAAHAVVSGDTITLTALVAHPDGSQSISDTASGKASDAKTLGEQLAKRLLDNGARELLASIGALDD